jgi:hypothetical protein
MKHQDYTISLNDMKENRPPEREYMRSASDILKEYQNNQSNDTSKQHQSLMSRILTSQGDIENNSNKGGPPNLDLCFDYTP